MLDASALWTLLESASEAVLVCDSSARIRFANLTAANLFGYSRDELLGRSVDDLVPEVSRGGHVDDRERYLAHPASRPMGTRSDLYGQRKDGSLVPLRIGLSYARTGEGLFVMALIIDVTELQRARRALQENVRHLERSNRELEQFASVASHDLQEPLRKIQAFSERLTARYREALDERGRDYLERMDNAATRMRGLITDLLSFSRVTTRAQPAVPVDLTATTREVLSDLEVKLEEVHGRVDVGTLPTIQADPLQVRQLLLNLIGNALKVHRPDVPPVVTVAAEEVDQEGRPVCVLTVSDNGIGFDEKYTDRIFNVFQRLHGRGTYEGTGIGLALCRKIAERHGGTITARSTPGEGSTMIVTLPVRATQESAP